MKIALIGDYREDVTAHRVIPLALDLCNHPEITYQWIHTNEIDLNGLDAFSAFWCVPASPYANMENVLAVIHYARTNNIPFLGTCGGYQHAVLEYAQNALGHKHAANAEVNPEAEMPLISALTCKLYDTKNTVKLMPESLVYSLYEKEVINEEYYCGFGVNAEYLSIFNDSDLAFTGFDESGDPRIIEIKKNRFFLGTAFQPERSAFSGLAHPVIQAFVDSI